MKNLNLYKMLNKMSHNIDNSEQLAVPFLAKRAEQYLKQMPHDKTIGHLAIILAKMADNNTVFITRKQFRDLYAKSHTNGTKARDLFSKELNIGEKNSSVKYAEKRFDTVVSTSSTDELLSTALTDALNGNPIRGYSDVMAKKAIASVSKSLDIWGINPIRLFVSAGDQNYLVIQADYETPKGITSIHIPLEVIGNNIFNSSIFVGNSSPQNLNNENLKNYIKAHAGEKLSLNGNTLLSALNKISKKETELSGAEMALIRLKEKRAGNNGFATEGITGLTVNAEAVPDVQAIKFEESNKFAEKFETAYGKAVMKFGSDKVSIARDVLIRELKSCGYNNPQLKLSKCSENSISYAVSLGTVAFVAPIKITNDLVQMPTILISNGSVKPFSAETIKTLYNEQADIRAAAVASPLYELKPSELINTVRVAIADKNLPKAEDALDVLFASGDKVSYATALQIFMSGLNNKEAENKATCSRILKTSTNRNPVCGHTGLTLDKVYQDKHGQCRPKYRQAMDDTFESFTPMSHKVFL